MKRRLVVLIVAATIGNLHGDAGDILVPTMGGAAIGGLAGGGRGAGIGAAAGFGLGLAIDSSKRSQQAAPVEYVRYDDGYTQEILELRAENKRLRMEVRRAGGSIKVPRKGSLGYRNLSGLSNRQLEREFNALIQEQEDLNTYLDELEA